jgi:tetratricopeptide (TPR) repeat protein
MIISLIKKALGKKTEQKPTQVESAAIKLQEKSKSFLNFIKENSGSVKNEIFLIREKFKNLRDTNYNLGVKHLENGHLIDATLRFRIIKKAWPEYYDAYYQLAYCLALKNKKDKAKEVINELLSKNPDYDSKARELLNHIEDSTQKASLGE